MIDLPPDSISSTAIEEVKQIEKPPMAFLGISWHISSSSPLGHIINIPKPDHDLTYAQLLCTQEEQNKIFELIHTIAQYGKFELLLNYKKRCESLGDQLQHIHTFKFLAFIFKDRTLKEDMKKIRSDYFKWKNFTEGLANTMSMLALKGKINKYVEDFSSDIGFPSDPIASFCERKDWKGLLEYLISNS